MKVTCFVAMRQTLWIAALFLIGCLPSLADTITITDFGAVPDDGQDDLTSIRKAISAAQNGDTVLFPKGTWLCRGTISLSSGVNLTGAGIEETILQAMSGRRKGPMLDLDGVRDSKISHFSIDAQGSRSFTQGIEASNCSQLHINHIQISNLVESDSFGPHGIYFSTKVTDSTIENCIITNIGIDTEWGAGIRIHKGSHRNLIQKNRIDRTGRGGILCAASTELRILSNQITNSGQTEGEGLGIELFDRSDRGIIEDNTVDHWLSFDTSHGLAVRRNKVGTQDGSHKWAGLELADSIFCIFTDNIVDGGAQVGISVSNTATKEYVFWGRNTIRRCTMWGAQIQGELGGARFMYFFDNTFAETYADHPKSLYGGGFGFRINDNAQHITFERNRFENNGSTGLQILGDQVNNLAFFENQIIGNDDDAIILEASSPLQWDNNSVTDNGVNDTSFKKTPVARPTISFSASLNAEVGRPVVFQAFATEAAQLLWDFGDGLPANAANPTHTFSKPGEFKVNLLVWDQQGRASRVEKTIRVR